MLFSNDEVVDFVEQHFECAWRSVGEAPRATIDFGGGRVMERTLGGNIVTWICDDEGRVIDVLPGLMDAPAYVESLEHALATRAVLESMPTDARIAEVRRRSVDGSLGWSRQARAQVEGQFLHGTSGAPASGNLLEMLQPFPAKTQIAAIVDFDIAVSKHAAVEDPIVAVIGRAKPANFGGPLEEDTWIAKNHLRPQALALVALLQDPKVDDLSSHVYRLVLQLDPDDPYLGLAPELLGRTDGFVPAR